MVELCFWSAAGQIPARLPRLALRGWKLSVAAEIPALLRVLDRRTTHTVGSGYKRAVMTLFPAVTLMTNF